MPLRLFMDRPASSSKPMELVDVDVDDDETPPTIPLDDDEPPLRSPPRVRKAESAQAHGPPSAATYHPPRTHSNGVAAPPRRVPGVPTHDAPLLARALDDEPPAPKRPPRDHVNEQGPFQRSSPPSQEAEAFTDDTSMEELQKVCLEG